MTPSGPANPHKAAIWASDLDHARSRALWAKTSLNLPQGTKGEGVPWTELFRKFGKHNLHRTVTLAAAEADLTIHLLQIKAAASTKFHPDQSYANSSPTSLPPYPPHILAPDAASAQQVLDALATTIQSGTGSAVDRDSAKIVRARGLYAVGQYEQAVAGLEGVSLVVPTEGWEGYDLTLRVVGHVVRALSLERLGRTAEAGEPLLAAVRLYDDVCDVQLNSPHLRDDVELHDVGESAAFRAALWSRAHAPADAYATHRTYVLRSALWPATFRPTKAVIVHRSFRRVMAEAGTWVDAGANNRAEEALIRRSTVLPRAGEVNSQYLAFLDEVAEAWRRSGSGKEGAAEVVETMYRALTHTFQSHRLLRHLARALVALGRHVEAAKALKLYAELFDKARETDAVQVARELRHLHERAAREAKGGETTAGDREKQAEADGQEGREGLEERDGGEDEPTDVDPDGEYVRTVCFAARVVTKYLGDPEEGYRLAKRGREVFDEGKDASLKADKVAESRVEVALGLSLAALAAKEADPDKRPKQQADAREHLEQGAALNPASWTTLYHLAFHLAELRQVVPALDAARQAVALPGAGIDAWHLLGLLVAARKELNESLAVLETALDEDDDAGLETRPPSGGDNTPPTGSSIGLGQPTGAPSLHPGNGHSTAPSLLPKTVGEFDDDSPRDAVDDLVAACQVRMTKNVVIEALEGAEAALLDQQATMAWFARAFEEVKAHDGLAQASNGTSAGGPTRSNSAVSLAVPAVGQESHKRAHSLLGRKRSLRKRQGTDDSAQRSVSAAAAPSTHSTVQVGSVSQAQGAARTLTPSYSSTSLADDAAINGGRGPEVAVDKRATKLLVDLWLMSAASYRRAGKLDDAKAAIAEAEQLDADDADVWAQFAALSVPTSVDTARTALLKALSFAPDHVASTVLLARIYLGLAAQDPTRLAFAEGLLDGLTRRRGWDVAEAWLELSRCFKRVPGGGGVARLEREREALKWALELERTRSVRGWEASVPRWL